MNRRASVLALALAAGGVLAAFSCNDESLAGLGDACILHTDCSSGICANSVCLAQGVDSDEDGRTNADELRAGSDPLNADSDGDAVPDGDEIGDDPGNPTDTDDDGTPDYRESNIADRDLDGEPDQVDPTDDIPELDIGRPCDSPQDCGDGICVGGQCYGADNDLDQDGLRNGLEREVGTNPLNPDSDADGERDLDEVGDDPQAPRDTDGDGRIDARESNRVDGDGDGTPDQTDPS